MVYPKPLCLGDTIGVLCPSSPISPHEAIQCKVTLESMGFPVVLSPQLTSNYGGYMAGRGASRGQELTAMFANPEINAIFCARGGHGSSAIIEHLDLDLIGRNPKIFVGYSDITNLHSIIANHCGFVTFHGPMVATDMIPHFDASSKASLFQAIHASTPYVYKNPPSTKIETLKEGRATGILTGGNLALLSASIGTPYEIDTKGKILFLEEVHESVSRIQRYLYHLKHAGKFRHCAGVLLGQFTKCTNEPCPSYTVQSLFVDLLKEYTFPVLSNLQSGHCIPNLTLPLGAICTIDSSQQAIFFHGAQSD